MTLTEKIDHCKFVVGRYDLYYDSVNNKANFWLAFNTFAIGVVLTTYKDAVKDVVPPNVLSWFNGGVVVFLLLTIASSLLILLASWPHLNTRKRANVQSRSLIYFDDVAAVELVDWQNSLTQADQQRLEDDFTTQAYLLATGLSRKYKRLALAGRLMAVQLGMLAYLIIVILVGKLL